ncbi:MAG: hypothetical protein QGG67_08980 [Gammaproteobacteria bacterium]|jgi:hypothetical protein|nr:hypothetical protein [Gammaproteobacteria bacterium]MDP6096103.1 hypothetical protein [Gammaproteobacteria bacterium]MDP7455372.1 hypothetical protein [Gammaproteobacteria bacterium]|tara:strand:- start:7362 stop:8411 length:1050 start_codon:yes stop_codon:yes gene_type:complete
MNLLSKHYELNDSSNIQEFYHSRGWTDGFPIIPPTPEAVQACLDWVNMPANELIGIEPVRERQVTAEKLAINAVMAGCLPLHFPVVVTAWMAMLKEEFLLHGATASTGGCAVLLILNGPVRKEIGARSEFSVLGSSDRATSVIGRAIRLGLINILEVSPGAIDRSTLGHPGKISYCVAEDEEESAWQSLAEIRGMPVGASAVTVLAAGAPRQIMNEWTTKPEDILDTYAAEMCANMLNYSIWAGNYTIVIPRQHRDHFNSGGWTKADIAEYLYNKARVKRADWTSVGKGSVVREKGDTVYSALPSPEHLLVIAAGGPAGGFGAIIPPWFGNKSQAVTAAIGACVDCEPI